MKTTNTTAQYLSHAAAIAVLMVFGVVTVIAGPVTVTNITAHQRIAAPIVDITYDLLNPSGGAHTVTIDVSTNAGAAFFSTCTNFSGAIGAGVTTGANKQVVWFAAGDLPGLIGVTARVRVTADDSMALIPAGAFTMGDTFSEGSSDERPTHSVYVSAFFMDKHEVTSQQWFEVRNWAMTNGYSFSAGAGKAPSHPVQTVSWYDCVKWCNARSQMEGRTPCYYTSSTFTPANLYTNGNVNISATWVNWSANGYRLPTEAEWEKAARGGLNGRRFPWNDLNITHTNANYYSSTYGYDTSATRGFHPDFDYAPMPYTSPVGYFAANGYGLYDMAGNVWEWCWDWYDGSWYSNGSATQTDTSGPTSSSYSYRVVRGGIWYYFTDRCRVAVRYDASPGITSFYFGFRAVRR